MNNQLVGLVRPIMRFFLGLSPLVILLLCTTLDCRSQSAGIPNAISALQSKQVSISEFEWQLINLNVRRAYLRHEDYSANPVVYDNRRQRFTTGFFLPANSSLLQSTARAQMEAFEIEINGLRLELVRTLGLSDNFAEMIGAYIEVDFVTYEAPDFFVIGKFRDSKVQLVHERLKPSR